MRNRKILSATFILALFFVAMAATRFFKLAQANPFMYHEWVSPPADATALVISVSAPKNNSIYKATDVTFNFNISTENTSIHYLLEAYFKADWIQDNVTVYEQNIRSPEFPKFWDYSKTFLDMPDGEYSIVITVRGGGGYAKGLTYYFFDMITTSVINFTVDATPPEVSILSPDNATYNSCDIALDFTVSEKPSLIRYSLDGQERSTLYGNTTLTDLPDGNHSLTIYAWDVAGNPAVPETVVFNIIKPESESFPTTMVIAPAASVAFVGVGLIVYLKRKR
ncbi:MAG: hypothetical protein NWE80_02885 [Candidatus Bathyarchaeota archaeon]|nr:hypothetical protein [Candidatus Bathyarchaeota archaeon]